MFDFEMLMERPLRRIDFLTFLGRTFIGFFDHVVGPSHPFGFVLILILFPFVSIRKPCFFHLGLLLPATYIHFHNCKVEGLLLVLEVGYLLMQDEGCL